MVKPYVVIKAFCGSHVSACYSLDELYRAERFVGGFFLRCSKNHLTDFYNILANIYRGASETGNLSSVHSTRSNSSDVCVLTQRNLANGKQCFNKFSNLTAKIITLAFFEVLANKDFLKKTF